MASKRRKLYRVLKLLERTLKTFTEWFEEFTPELDREDAEAEAIAKGEAAKAQPVVPEQKPRMPGAGAQ